MLVKVSIKWHICSDILIGTLQKIAQGCRQPTFNSFAHIKHRRPARKVQAVNAMRPQYSPPHMVRISPAMGIPTKDLLIWLESSSIYFQAGKFWNPRKQWLSKFNVNEDSRKKGRGRKILPKTDNCVCRSIVSAVVLRFTELANAYGRKTDTTAASKPKQECVNNQHSHIVAS